MTGFVFPEIQPNERADLLGLDLMTATGGEGFAAAFSEQMTRNPTATLLRGLGRLQYYETTDELGNPIPARTPSRILAPTEANEKYGIEGKLKFDADIPEPVAQELRALKLQEIERQDVLRRAQAGLGTTLTAGLVASILDPLNVGSAFIPVVGPARFAGLSVGAGRAARGAIEGAVGAAVLEPIVLSGARFEQADYDIVDSLLNVGFGTALGAGLHLAGGAVGDRLRARAEASAFQRAIDDLPRQDQEALARTALAQMVEGRPIDVGPVLDVIRASSRERLLSGTSARAYEPGGPLEIKMALETPGVADIMARQAPEPRHLQFVDTRGGNERFHGTSGPITSLAPGEYMYSTTNIYGQGFYTTDAVDAGAGYMKKGKGGNPTLYRVTEQNNPNLFDMEAPLSPQLKKELREILGDLYSNVTEDGAPIRNLRELYDEARSFSSELRYSADDVQMAFDGVITHLQNKGFDGFSHVGGLKTRTPEHSVKIYWTPERHVSIEPVDVEAYRLQNAPAPTEPANISARALANLRAVDEIATQDAAAMAQRVSEEQGAAKAIADEIKVVEDDLLYLETLRPADAEPVAKTPLEQEADVYAKAWKEAAACQVRKG